MHTPLRAHGARRAWLYALAALLGVMNAACVPRSQVRPQLASIVDQAPCAQAPRVLVVFLPGMYDTPADLVREGFVAALRERAIAADVVLADANLGYYRAGIITERVHRDIVAPALARGYRQIWLVGISLGGYGALSYALEQRTEVAGVLAIAPYLGQKAIIDTIANAGGLASWPGNPPATNASSAQDAQDLRVWRWLQQHTKTSQTAPRIYLGYGTEDKFANSNAMLAQVLPAAQVFATAGGHDWEPWRRVWRQFLARQDWPRCR